MHPTSKDLKLAGSGFFALAVAVVLAWVLVCLRDSLAWLSTALGLAGGWTLGILLSPYQSEQDRFKEYLRLFAAFATGWLTSKMDRLFDLAIDPARGAPLLQPAIAHRVILCLTALLLAMTATYVARKYLSFGPNAEQPPRSE